jgi:hypothetical protein
MAGTGPGHDDIGIGLYVAKFFGSFFQERTAFFAWIVLVDACVGGKVVG